MNAATSCIFSSLDQEIKTLACCLSSEQVNGGIVYILTSVTGGFKKTILVNGGIVYVLTSVTSGFKKTILEFFLLVTIVSFCLFYDLVRINFYFIS